MIFLIILLYALTAGSFTIAKAVLSHAQPIFFIGFRMTIAGGLLLAYCLWRRKIVTIQTRDWIHFVPIVLFHIYLGFVLDLVSLQYMTSFKGAFLYNLSPFLTALFSYLYFNEKMTIKKWIGLVVGFSGFLPELVAQAPQEAGLGGVFFLSWAELYMLGSVLASVIGWSAMRALVQKGYSTLYINGIGMLIGGLMAFVSSYVGFLVPTMSGLAWQAENWQPFPVYTWWPFLYLTALIILICNIAAYNLHGHLLRTYTATFISFAGFLSPLFAALFGWLWLGEQPHWHFFFSIFVVIVGLVIFYSEELRQGYIVK